MPFGPLKSVTSRGIRAWIVPAAIGVVAASAELGGEGARAVLRYARDGLAAGELWRLVTGHLVHLGPTHMLMNVAALALLAFLFIPLLKSADWLIGGLAAALAIDAGLYWLEPGIEWYVGLSGVLHGFWALACVKAMLLQRREAIPLTVLLVVKIGYERVIGPVPFTGAVAAGPVVTEAHAFGALGGAVTAVVLIAIAGRQRPL
jgi:rhomboid family GlyGly-CTERM serine protease